MRFHALTRIAAPAGLLACVACAPAVQVAAPTSGSAGGVGGPVRPAADPAAESARFIPVVTPRETLGAEPGGGVRAIENGVRVVALPGGAMLAADDRFPGPPTQVLALPERLGGGFLFVVGGTTIWRAERWLGPARVLYVSSTRIGRAVGSRIVPGLVAGLDRVYLQTEHEIWRAIDGVRGVELPLGPWPASPNVGSLVAADGWRAIATADLRGTVATFDAGATWKPLHAPPDERETRLLADAEEAAALGAVGETTAPRAAVDADREAPHDDASPGAGPLGGRPLVAAVEDGWPLDDGTAIVARDGVLARVRASDGAIESIDPGAYPLRPSRCHAMPLGARGGLGFACGEPRGRTVVYALDATRGRMVEDRRFDSPRVVLPSGNGAVSVRGSCDAHESVEDAGTHAYCVRGRDGEWRETRLTGAIGGEGASPKAPERMSAPIRERLVALEDGRLALVWPPSDVAAARLMLIDGAAVRSVPIRFPELSPDVRRALEEGLWLDGFEERRAGVLGGWIASGSAMLGVEIGLDGAARFGAYVHDAGTRIVSGPYGLAWTKGHVGLETTDGGMTWAPIDGPAPIDEAPPMAACGPVGCEVGGWLRIGWREPTPLGATSTPGSSREGPVRVRPLIALACEGLAAAKGRDPLAAFATPTTTSEEVRYTFHAPDLREGRDVDTRIAALGRAVAWGPRGSDWDRSARWTVQWASPFAGADEAHTTIASQAPALFTGIARIGTSSALQWSIASGDDPVHALLVVQGSGRDASAAGVFELEADHAPSAVHGPENAPLGHIDAALRAGSHWYLAAHTQPTESIVWRVDGAYARELARVPRWFERGRGGAPAPRLAWRTDGRALGFVVDAGPTLDHHGITRWVAPIDLETGAVGDVELLGSADLADAETLTACTNDDAGWSLDTPLAGSLPVEGASEPALLSSVVVRVRLGGPHPCLERVAGRLSPSRMTAGRAKAEPPRAPGATLNVTTTRDDERDTRSLRCVVRSAGRGSDAPSSSRQLPSK